MERYQRVIKEPRILGGIGKMNYHHRQHRKWFLQYQSDIVRHVHSAATPLGKTLRHT